MTAANDRTPRFRPTLLTACIRAARAAGAHRFTVTFDHNGAPVVDVFDDGADTSESAALAALEAFDREQAA